MTDQPAAPAPAPTLEDLTKRHDAAVAALAVLEAPHQAVVQAVRKLRRTEFDGNAAEIEAAKAAVTTAQETKAVAVTAGADARAIDIAAQAVLDARDALTAAKKEA